MNRETAQRPTRRRLGMHGQEGSDAQRSALNVQRNLGFQIRNPKLPRGPAFLPSGLRRGPEVVSLPAAPAERSPWPATLLSLFLLVPSLCGAASSGGRRFTGLTEPILDATLNAPVPGIIARIHFAEGEFVEEGKILLELDKRMEELDAERRKVVMETRQAELDRLERLIETTKAVSQEELEKKRLEQRESAAEYELAAERIRKREIRAPFSGFVVDLFEVRPGEGCRENETPLVRLVDTRRCHLVCNLEARAAHTLAVGQPVKLEIESGSSALSVEGRVDFVSPVVDPASGLLKVKVLFENGEGKIRPGVAGVMILGD